MVGVCMWEVGGNDIRYTGHYSSGHICRAWNELDGDEKGGKASWPVTTVVSFICPVNWLLESFPPDVRT